MNIKVLIKDCEHLMKKSFYNNHYYKLPFTVNGYDILFEHCQEEYNSFVRSIGYFDDAGTYQDKFYLHTDERGDSEYFEFDTDCLKPENEWT